MADIDATALRDFVSQQISEMIGAAVDVGKDFFSVGGDSFDAVMLAFAIEERYGLTVNVAEVIDADSISSLCERLAHG